MIAAALSSVIVLLLFASSGRRAATGRSLRHEAVPPHAAPDAQRHDRWLDRSWRDRGRHRSVLRAVTAGAALLIVGPLMTVAAAVCMFAWPRVRAIQSARTHQRLQTAALPDAVELLVLVMHTGLTPHHAMVLLGERAPLPTRSAFVEVGRRTSRGVPLADALHALPELLGPAATNIADTLAMAERHGTPITHALEQLSFEVRERRQRQSEAAARQLPIRLAFPLVTCTLPSFVLIAIVPAVLGALASLDASGL